MKTVSMEMLGDIFTQAIIDVVSKVSGFSLEAISNKRDDSFDEFVAVMSLNSAKGGMFFLSAGESAMRTLCSFIEGTPEDEITKADIEDVLCELLNMTAGNVRPRLVDTEYMYSLSSPIVLNGANISITTKKRVGIISQRLGSGGVTVKFNIVY